MKSDKGEGKKKRFRWFEGRGEIHSRKDKTGITPRSYTRD